MVRTPSVPRSEGVRLTPRQRTFLEKLMEVYRETRLPVHYSVLAVRLGVNRFSAYDMLKVLEQKGFASSSYAFLAGHSGPGRSMVVFAPTPQATTVLAKDADRADEDWPRVRERVLSRLREARETDYRDALNELVNRLSDAWAPLTFCTNMIGALLLNTRRARARVGSLHPLRALSLFRADKDQSGGLEALAGLSLGITLAAEDEPTTALTQRLLDHVQRYQMNLGRLSLDARLLLAQFLEEALDILDRPTVTNQRGGL